MLTEDDFRGNEGDLIPQVPVMVTKSLRLATRVVLEVVPLTVAEVSAIQPPLSTENIDIPDDNPFSPPYAGIVLLK